MRSKWPYRSESTTILGEYRIAAIFRRERDVHRIGQVQVKSCVPALDLARGLEQADCDVRDDEPLALRLEEDVVDEGRAGVGAEPCEGKMIYLSQHERR